jgi:hypothetical protein
MMSLLYTSRKKQSPRARTRLALSGGETGKETHSSHDQAHDAASASNDVNAPDSHGESHPKESANHEETGKAHREPSTAKESKRGSGRNTAGKDERKALPETGHAESHGGKKEAPPKENVTASETEGGDIAEMTPKGDVVHHVTYPGETLSMLARWYTHDRANAGRIARINSITQPDKLNIGDMIVIPSYLVKTKNRLTEEGVQSLTIEARGK